MSDMLLQIDGGQSARQPHLLSAGHGAAARGQEPRPAGCLQRNAFYIFVLLVFLCPATYLTAELCLSKPQTDAEWHRWFSKMKYASIPIVSVLFTWWHVWLGIQMCFYPIHYRGCCKPVLGWQGIVPRRAEVMASKACDLMIGPQMITVEEIINRIEPEDFFNKLGSAMESCSSAVLCEIGSKHFKSMWPNMPLLVKEELMEKVLEETKKTFHPVMRDFKENINDILDIKQLAIDTLKSDPALLVEMFQDIGRNEFVFMQHLAAVMGFVLGCIQMFVWSRWQAWWNLPLSGLIIGYFTNWLAITMIFRPLQPHRFCCGHINIQGIFLKRQQEVATKLSDMISTRVIFAQRIIEYILRSDGFEKVMDIYTANLDSTIDGVLGRAKGVVNTLLGSEALPGIKDEVIQATVAELPKHSKEISDYLDSTFALSNTIGPRLRGLPPEKFERMLRPVFEEDEWMVLLLGGVLGVAVGTVQAIVLGS